MTERKAAPDRAAVLQTSVDGIIAQNGGMLDHAQALRALDLRIFPVCERGKLPAIAGGHGHLDATTDNKTAGGARGSRGTSLRRGIGCCAGGRQTNGRRHALGVCGCASAHPGSNF